ncbi:RUS family member 1 [Taenia crassiceps]|uniref:RUS family member 1 n=1 Tax=Taenia crassiceps TaxID=6207 RepID=A0ABR4QS41_9CEST
MVWSDPEKVVSEMTVYDNYMGQLFSKYEFFGKKSGYQLKTYPRTSSFVFFAKSAFLPEGYPNSVSKDYLEYQIWDTIQAIASSIISALAGQAVLIGVGVGDSNASILAASLTWIFKDGAGMVGRIVFAGWQGVSLDSQCKQWRIFADVLNDVAFFLELLSLHAVSLFPLIVCASSVLRALVGMAGGATRAAVTQHQALEGNMADVAAKDGSQETLSNLLALVVNLILITMVTGNLMLIWLLFTLLTPIHLYANWRAVRCLEFTTLNRARFSILLQDWLRKHDELSDQLPPLLSVHEVNRREPILWPLGTGSRKRTIHLGCSFEKLTWVVGDCKLLPLLGVFAEERYILYCPEWKKSGRKGSHLTIYVCIQTDASSMDMFKAMFHVEVICALHHISTGSGHFEAFWSGDDGTAFFAWTLGRVNCWLPRLMRCFDEVASKRTESKWDLSVLQFDPDPWRIYRNVYHA